MSKCLVILVLPLLIIFLTGCMSDAKPNLTGYIEIDPDFSVRDPFCIYNVHGSVYNSGNGIAKDVIVNIDFIDTQDNQIRLSKTVILGDIGPGVSKDFKNIPLEGKCGRKYSVNMTIAKILITTHKGSIEGE